MRKNPKQKKNPPLSIFPRGKRGIYYVRLRTGNLDKWICTGTSDKDEALKEAEKIEKGKHGAELRQEIEKKTAGRRRKIVSAITDVVNERDFETSFEDGYKKWISLTSSYSDLNERTIKNYESVFKKFSDWCKLHDIGHVEAVDNATALEYSKYLWDYGINGKTYNEHLKLLSRIFSTLDAALELPYRDPFDKRKVTRKKKSEIGAEGHQPLEPDQLKAVIKEAAKESADYRDLIIISSQTGLRLIDAVGLSWSSISADCIELKPSKTQRSGNRATIPITETLRKLLDQRRASGTDGYVLPSIAEHYQRNTYYVTKKCKDIFKNALNTGDVDITRKEGCHRKRRASVYSFHSLRTTFMSLLATQDVSVRDAMRMLAWESPEMIRVYEKMLEAYKGKADKRARKIVSRIPEFKMDIPEVELKTEPLRPSSEELKKLASKMTNTAIAEKYGVSETAVRKWLKKQGIS